MNCSPMALPNFFLHLVILRISFAVQYQGFGFSLKFPEDSGAAKHSSGLLATTNPIVPADAVTNIAADDDRNLVRDKNGILEM